MSNYQQLLNEVSENLLRVSNLEANSIPKHYRKNKTPVSCLYHIMAICKLDYEKKRRQLSLPFMGRSRFRNFITHFIINEVMGQKADFRALNQKTHFSAVLSYIVLPEE
jgi:hypothetical protein